MSAQKQCPKCGEKNPAEAVMCWACYTSLTGGAGALAGAPAGGAGAIAGSTPMGDSDSGEKKNIDPKHLAIIGVGLLVAVGFGVSTLMGSGEEEDPLPPFTNPSTGTGGGEPVPPQQTIPVNPGDNPSGPKQPVGDPPLQQSPYRLVVSPDPRQAAATIAIVPTDTKISEGLARSYADMAYQNLMKVRKFPKVEVYVITNQTAGSQFAAYQRKRRNAPLTQQDYMSPTLMPVWSNTIVRYENVNGKAYYSSPQKSPTGFWRK